MDAVRARYAGLSLLCGAAAAVLSWHALASARGDPDLRDGAAVLVFAADAPEGALLKPEAVRWANWPALAVTTGMIRAQDGAARPAFDPVLLPVSYRAGDPVPESLLREKASQPPVRAGMRLLAVRLRDDAIASFLRPGMQVDLLFGGPRPSALRNIGVVGLRRQDEGAAHRDRHTLLLVEVSPRQAALAAQGMASGEITVALASTGRNSGSDRVSQTTGPAEPAREESIVLIKYGALAGGRELQTE